MSGGARGAGPACRLDPGTTHRRARVTRGTEPYFPTGTWDRQDPEAAGLDAGRLAAAVAYAQAEESRWPRSLYYPDGR